MLSINNILDFISRNKRNIIYGAGTYANLLYTYIRLEKLENYINFFVVSSLNNNLKQIEQKEVKVLSDVQSEIYKYGIIIAMTEKNSVGICENLKCIEKNKIISLNEKIMCEIKNEIFYKLSKMPIKRNKIFIDCFAGLGYRCNCKYIAQELINTNKNVELVWTVSNLNEKSIPVEIKQVQYNSYDYFKELYTAGIWICNDGYRQWIQKRREQYYINTWHGTGPFKKVCASLYEGDNHKRKYYEKLNSIIDVFISNSRDNTEMFRDSFCYNGEIYECGSPRNDIFFQKNNIKEKICSELDIDVYKKIVLYAPTFRKGGVKSFEYYDLDMKRVLQALQDRFHREFVLFYRFHHLLYKYDKCKNFYLDEYNVTLYPDMQELLVAADVLITDYSSSMWDFSLQNRPVFLYHNDRSEYENDRGFYSSPKEWPYPQAHSNNEMEEIIRNFDEEKYLRDLKKFIEKYQSFDDGYASEKVVERIMDVIEHPDKYGKE